MTHPWILLLQEFDLEILDKKGVKNVMADHLSRIPNAPTEKVLINEDFPDEHILVIFKKPWYADIINYLATGQIPSEWTKQDKYRFFAQVRFFQKKNVSFQVLSWSHHQAVCARGRTHECITILPWTCFRWILWSLQNHKDGLKKWVLLAYFV